MTQREAKDLQDKFRAAHNNGEGHGKSFEVAHKEMKQGSKRSSWVWYIFPQHENCPGSTFLNKKFGLTTRKVLWFLADPSLRENYLEVLKELKKHLESGKTLKEIVNRDDKKVVSSLTLFEMIADELHHSDSFKDIAYSVIGTGRMDIDDFNVDMEDMTELLRSVWLSLEGYERCMYTRNALKNYDDF